MPTELRPHQQRTVDKAVNDDMLVVHNMGSGKTLTSIAALGLLGKPGVVFTPASLVSNYNKEIDKHSPGLPVDVMSVNTAAERGFNVPAGSTVVIDEAHGSRNMDTIKARYLRDQSRRSGRTILLTGTPVYNAPSDIAPLLNIVHRQTVLPTNPTDFNRYFVNEEKIKPSPFGRLIGIQPGVVQSLKNEGILRKLMRGKVDYHEETKGYPTLKEETVDVPISPEQQKIYDLVSGKMPFWTRFKMRNNLPPSKSEAKQLNSFLTGVRQASLSVAPYSAGMDPIAAAKSSPKLMRALADIKRGLKEDPSWKGLTYSNYLEAGLNPMQALLNSEGIPNALFSGELNKRDKQDIVDRYNSGELRVLLGSSSAGEGLDLKGTRLVQVLEPHFNNSKIRQVIGRAARIGSHTALPEDKQNVTVKRYRTVTRPSWSDMFFGNDTLADEYIQSRANEKDRIFDQIKRLLKEEGS